MFVPRETINRLNKLSVDIWGIPSKWTGYLKKGVLETQGKHGRTGLPITSVVVWHTLESLEILMLDLKKQMEESKVKKI